MSLKKSKRSKTLEQIAEILCDINCSHSLRVAIDGVDGSGKTNLADELIDPIEKHSRKVIRASSDGFHFPRQIRYRRGQDSPEGYFRDSFDNEAMINNILGPLGPEGNGKYRLAVYDYHIEQPVRSQLVVAPRDSILLFDGVFLHRPELISYWDFSIFLSVSIEISISRAVKRDQVLRDIQEEEKYNRIYQQRYGLGQEIYLQEVKLKDLASLVLDNNDFDNLCLI